MKRILLLIVSLALFSCKSTDRITKDIDVIDKQLKWGIVLYERGEYESAFQELSELAAWGYKDAQYALAFMFLKGQYVEQSTLIGMGWLGVATESEIEDWEVLFNDLYSKASNEDKKKFDIIIEDYKSKFGLKAQHVKCSKTTNGVSKKIITKCTKSDKLSKIYEIDLTEADL
ncbi:sel1 repeat family protein [Pseudoalteromonas sp. SSDWG2]|uniref:sel1 repeat family protein n=1 Tax=Pseudoalteromonas sp. SSDWG2 TaxID=3139391 RepID=UPI003BA864C7